MELSERFTTASQQIDERAQPTNLTVQLLTTERDHARQPATLLSIPRELRDNIYKHLLFDTNRISLERIERCWCCWRRLKFVDKNYAAISETCRKLREETTEVYFTKNAFLWTAFRVPQGISDNQIHHIRNLRVDTKGLHHLMNTVQGGKIQIVWKKGMKGKR